MTSDQAVTDQTAPPKPGTLHRISPDPLAFVARATLSGMSRHQAPARLSAMRL